MNNNKSQTTISFGKDYNQQIDAMLARLNGSLTSDLKFVARKAQTQEVKGYLSKYIEKVLYSKNFNCYIFVLKIKESGTTVLVDYFDVIGDF